MLAISQALNRLLEDCSWFARAHEVKLLVARVAPDLRSTALRVLPGLEFHADNRSPWVLLEDAALATEPGWQTRANRLHDDWERRRSELREKAGLELPRAEPGHAVRPGSDRAANATAPFRAAAASVLRALQPPLEGLVIVLAPTLVDDLERFGHEVRACIADPQLAGCRWIWLTDASGPRPPVLDQLVPAPLESECVPEPEQQQKDFEALAAPAATAGGGAGPRGVTAPARIDQHAAPPQQVEERLRAAGLSTEYLEKAPELQRLLFGAALAMKDGRGAEAVRLQAAARDLAGGLGLPQVQLPCQIALASYLCACGDRTLAVNELRAAIGLAVSAGLALQEAQARLALALLLSLAERLLDAAREYVACASAALKASSPLIAIEAYRMAGQLALRMSAEHQAVDCFEHAIRVAEGTDRASVQSSSAPEAARRLAQHYRERGLRAQSDSLYAQADAMERGEVGIEPTEPDPPAPPRSELRSA